jgi:hypothetical protein
MDGFYVIAFLNYKQQLVLHYNVSAPTSQPQWSRQNLNVQTKVASGPD